VGRDCPGPIAPRSSLQSRDQSPRPDRLESPHGWANIEEKIDLYLEAGAGEVWVVDTERRIRVFGPEEREDSQIVPDGPQRL